MKTIRILLRHGEPIPVTGTVIQWNSNFAEGTSTMVVVVADDCPLPDGAVVLCRSCGNFPCAPYCSAVPIELLDPPGPAHWVESSDLASVAYAAYRAARVAMDPSLDHILVQPDAIPAEYAPCWEAAALAVARRVKGEA